MREKKSHLYLDSHERVTLLSEFYLTFHLFQITIQKINNIV
ncbi:hypothetical protein M2147_000852 [Ohessyouella blattaphilus]